MKITIEVEPKELAALALEMQKQPVSVTPIDIEGILNERLQKYEAKLRARNSELKG